MSSLMFLQYDEDQWFRYSEKEQQECCDAWIKKYLPNPECHGIVLKLIPDPVFPRGEQEYPYVHWQVDLTPLRKPKRDFEVLEAMVTIVLTKEAFDVPLRKEVEMELLKYPNGTKYRVANCNDEIVLQGRVNK